MVQKSTCQCGATLRAWQIKKRSTVCLECAHQKTLEWKLRQPCRVCGVVGRTSASNTRNGNFICGFHHALQRRAYKRKKYGTKPRGKSIESNILDAIEAHGLPTNINEISVKTGYTTRQCSVAVRDLIRAGILVYTGARVRYGNGGPSFCFELASQAEQRKVIKRRNAEEAALVELGAALHSKATIKERPMVEV